jgi:mitosis inhibitor protein kinase SWE1
VFSRVLVIGKYSPVWRGKADDRLRHLEEVDILRHLSVRPHPNVIKFEDAWEQNRQLFIQTELCLGSLAFFLLEYGSVVERLDEARVWKIVRELSDVSISF